MSLSGLCEVCKQPAVEHSCDRCGNLVCNRHFDDKLQVCDECVTEVDRGDPTQPTGRRDPSPDGIDTFEF